MGSEEAKLLRLHSLLRAPLEERLQRIVSGTDAGCSLLLRPHDFIISIRRVMALSSENASQYSHIWQSEYAFAERARIMRKRALMILRNDPSFQLVNKLEAVAAALLHFLEQCKCGQDAANEALAAAGRARVGMHSLK